MYFILKAKCVVVNELIKCGSTAIGFPLSHC